MDNSGNTATTHGPVVASKGGLWQNRDYLCLLAGQAVSSIGSQMKILAFPLLVLALTNSPAQAGLVGALRSVPTALLSLPAGVLVDRWDRKRLMILCDLGRALVLGSIPLAMVLGRLTIVQLALVSLVEGLLFVFFNIAESSCLPQVVRRDQLGQALSQNQVVESSTQLLGPPLGGAVYALGAAVPFLLDTISYTASVGTLLLIRTPLQAVRTSSPASIRHELVEGLAWLWSQPILRFIAFLLGGLFLCSTGYNLIVILLAQRLQASAFEIGLIFAGGGLGNVLGGLLTPWLQRQLRFGPMAVISIWLWVLTWVCVIFAPTIPTLILANTVAYLTVPFFLISQGRYRLSVTPDQFQGRVYSVFRMLMWGSQPLSLGLTGLLLERWGPITTNLIFFVPQVALALVATGYLALWRTDWPTHEGA